jgi:L-aminopeptidase/D-esterase-like protein
MHGAITDVPGIRVGHYTDLEAATGCTVVLCEDGAVAGVDVRGSAPGTRETDLLRPMNLVERVHAVLLSGGSAFGLDAAGGVVRYLEEKGVGFETPAAKVPGVPAAILFDLGIGRPDVRPGPDEGRRACLDAGDGPVAEGTVGAGTGATVGKLLGPALATKGGIGTASVALGDGVIVAALVAVNPFGDVVDPATGRIVAGTRHPDGGFADSSRLLREGLSAPPTLAVNTTIGVVATNAALTKEQVNKVAQMAHDGMARAVRPCHTMYDGDTTFALALGEAAADVTVVGSVAAEVFAEAIVRAVTQATGLCGVPAAGELSSG